MPIPLGKFNDSLIIHIIFSNNRVKSQEQFEFNYLCIA